MVFGVPFIAQSSVSTQDRPRFWSGRLPRNSIVLEPACTKNSSAGSLGSVLHSICASTAPDASVAARSAREGFIGVASRKEIELLVGDLDLQFDRALRLDQVVGRARAARRFPGVSV